MNRAVSPLYLVVMIDWGPQLSRSVLTTELQAPCGKPLFSWKQICRDYSSVAAGL